MNGSTHGHVYMQMQYLTHGFVQAQLMGLQHDHAVAGRLLHCRIMHCQALQVRSQPVAGAGGNGGQPLSATRLAAEVQALGDSVPIPPPLQVGMCAAMVQRSVCESCLCENHGAIMC